MNPSSTLDEKLSQLGYCAPLWDEFQLDKFCIPLLTCCQTALGSLSTTQLFLVKVWPRAENFFQEEEDSIVHSHARTVKKNGLITRIFSVIFDSRSIEQQWQLILEKRLDPGLHAMRFNRMHHSWALQEPEDVYEEKFHYSTSFDTQAHSIKYKINRDRSALAKNKQNFLREVKQAILEAYRSNDASSGPQNTKNVFHKGKELEFSEGGNQITWAFSMRRVGPNQNPISKCWNVTRFLSAPMRDVAQVPRRGRKSMNPFEEDIEEMTDGEAIEMNRQIVEQKINEFMDFVWPSIRNFYLEIEQDLITSLSLNSCKNGRPTRSLEFHLDTLNERNRWRFLFEMSLANLENSKRHWANVKPKPSESFIEIRTYNNYEKRGTSSKHGEDKTDYFQGFYKRWFLTEIQTKLAKAYAQIGVFDLMPETLDQNFYDFGRDLEFSDDNDLITWSVSVQRILKYPERNVPSDVWCYGLTDSYLPPSPANTNPFEEADDGESDSEFGQISEISACDADISQASEWTMCSATTQGQESNPKTSKLRNFARSFVRPITKKPAWLPNTSVFRRNTLRNKPSDNAIHRNSEN